MDLLARKPGVSDAQVCASAERQEADAIVVGGSVDECGATEVRKFTLLSAARILAAEFSYLDL